MQEAISGMVVESTRWIRRLNLPAKRFRPEPLTKAGDNSLRCSKTAQKSFSAISAGRTLSAWERLLRVGGVAPRMLESGPDCNRKHLLIEADHRIRPVPFKELDKITVCQPKELTLS